MTTLHFEDSPVRFKNFSGRTVSYFPSGKRFFYIKLDLQKVHDLEAEGYRVKKFHGEYHLLVHINEEYDTEVAHLDVLQFDSAEIFVEGFSYDLRNMSGISARLISITPKQ